MHFLSSITTSKKKHRYQTEITGKKKNNNNKKMRQNLSKLRKRKLQLKCFCSSFVKIILENQKRICFKRKELNTNNNNNSLLLTSTISPANSFIKNIEKTQNHALVLNYVTDVRNIVTPELSFLRVNFPLKEYKLYFWLITGLYMFQYYR